MDCKNLSIDGVALAFTPLQFELARKGKVGLDFFSSIDFLYIKGLGAYVERIQTMCNQ